MSHLHSGRFSQIVFLVLTGLVLVACGGGGEGDSGGDNDGGGGGGATNYTVMATAGTGGSISPASATVSAGATASFTVIPDSGNSIASVTGCGGTLAGNTYTTAVVNADCTVTASFVAALPSLSITGASIVEGDSGTGNLSFTVTLSAVSSSVVSVDYATSDDTATAGEDYTTASGTLTIPAGNLSADISIEVLGDTLVENDEILLLTLSNPGGATLETASANGRILNDDTAPLLTSIHVGNRAVREGDAGTTTLDFMVTIPRSMDSDIRFDYATSDGTATAGSDYTAATGTATISAGNTSTQISIEVIGDTLLEGDEIIALNLSNPVNGVLEREMVMGVIQNDDASPPALPRIQLTASAYYFYEYKSSIGFIIVGPPGSSVDYATSDGTAVAGEDYNPESGTITFPVNGSATTTSATVMVDIIDDSIAEGDETFTLTLSNPVGANLKVTSGASSATATGIILDDEGSLPAIRVDVDQAGVLEGDVSTRCLKFKVSLRYSDLSSDVMVDYVVSDGSALAGKDYQASSGTLTIPAGSGSSDICVTVLGDSEPEGNETLTLTLSNPSGDAVLGIASAKGIIIDNDAVTGKINDTGITLCGDDQNNDLVCPAHEFPGQDGDSGRDATHNHDWDGHAGYSYTKLDNSGRALYDQDGDYASAPWACVRDNVTGLIWEVKTDDEGLRDKDWTYTWYNSTGVNDGGDPGVANGGSCVDAVNCDTEKYVAAVNAAGLCGYNDWRLPTVEEMLGISDMGLFGGIDIKHYFPNTSRNEYVTSLPVAYKPGRVWTVGSILWLSDLSSSGGVRLVRGGEQ